MFGKIKGKLKGIFDKNEELVEENADEETILDDLEKVDEDLKKEEPKKKEKLKEEKPEDENDSKDEMDEESEDEPKEEKKGFLGRLFGKKEEEDDLKEEEIEEIQDEVLEDLETKEKEEIKSGKDLSEDEIEKHKEELEKEISKDLKKDDSFVEEKLEEELKKEEPIQVEEPKVTEENLDTQNEVEDEPEEEKKGILGSIFGKKKKEEDLNQTLEKVDKDVDFDDKNSQDEEEDSGLFKKAVNVLKKKKITEEDFTKIWDDLQIFLLEINVAFEIVQKIENELKYQLVNNSFDRFGLNEKIREVMVIEVEKVLLEREGNFLEEVKKHKESGEPLKILILGVNGTGKTTSIGKVIKFLQNNDLSVVVGAADTFRAAAVDQLEKHCDNLGVRCIKHKDGSDPAAVAFDTVSHAKAKNVDVVLIDTAGRMPNNPNLMAELEKVKRVSKADMSIFIGDSISGNDLIDQINLFDKGVGISGVVLTKVDTDERPGSVVTCAYSIKKPIYFLGIGQDYDDLIKFDSTQIAHKLFSVDDEEE